MMYAHYPLNSNNYGDITTLNSSIDRIFNFLYETFYHGFSRTSAPFLGIISGYFVYRYITKSGYKNLVMRRFWTLMIPVIIWSGVFILFDFIKNNTGGDLSEFQEKYLSSYWIFLNYIIPIQYWPANYPLHYLGDLFKICLISPIIIMILRHLSLSGRFLLILGLALWPLTPSAANVDNVMPRWDLVIFFMLGLSLAIESKSLWDILNHKPRALSWVLALIAIIVVSPYWEHLFRSSNSYESYLGYILVMLIKCAGIVFFIRFVQFLVRNEWFAQHVPSRRVVFYAFCTHALTVIVVQKVASVSAYWNIESEMSFLLFILFPLLAFAVAYFVVFLLKTLQENVFAPKASATFVVLSVRRGERVI